MTRAVEGLKSDALRAALQAALERPEPRQFAQLEQLVCMHGGLPGIKPNLKLAAAIGAEVAEAPPVVLTLLTRWAAEDAAPDTPRAFLPVAAAHGLAQRIRAANGEHAREQDTCWRALQELAADERAVVRVGTLDALVQLAAREGGADLMIDKAETWLLEPDRELCFGATASALDVLSEARVLAVLRDHTRLLSLLTRVIDDVADAPRSAQRSDGRRRVLRSLGPSLARVIAVLRGAQSPVEWFIAECTRATHPEIRAALSEALQRLPDVPQPPPRAVIDALRASLEGSQKPVRDHARVRPGTGRGKRSRPLR
ncbi:MAG: hypothetical protein ABW321_16815 [Polyangiales bacterium]